MKIDIRNYIFPIHVGQFTSDGNAFQIDRGGYMGTGFFIAKNGTALTAAHCLPNLDALEAKHLTVGIFDGKYLISRKILSCIKWDNYDIALLKVEGESDHYFDLCYEQVLMGTDLMTFGIPEHSMREGIEVRLLKGYVTFAGRFLELNFPAVRGMSGSPVLLDGRVIGVVSANSRSEYVEDQVEELVELTDKKEKISIISTKAIVNYALVEPVLPLLTATHEVLDGRTIPEYISFMNEPT